MKRFSLFIILFSILGLRVHSQSISSINPEFVYPMQACDYSFSTDLSYWVVKGGSFSNTNRNDTVRYLVTSKNITVYWNNEKGTEDKAAEGILFAVYNNNNKIDTAQYVQKIYSLNGLNAPIFESWNDTVRYIGIDTIYLRLNEILLYTGSKNHLRTAYPLYEWTVPNGWITTCGQTGIFNHSEKDLYVVTDGFGEKEIKYRVVNERYFEDATPYAVAKVKKTKAFLEYPPEGTIKYGHEQTFTYKVPASNNYRYEWSIPKGWTVTSGANTNQITVKKPLCSTQADVKVRMVSAKESSQWYDCPNSKVTDPVVKIPDNVFTTIPFEISIDIPSENIQDFNVSANNIELVDFISANTRKFRFNAPGDVSIQISVKLKGADCATYTFTKKVTVKPFTALNMQILGDGIINPQSTFTSKDEVDNIRWETSKNIRIVSGQGTSTIVCEAVSGSQGDGEITMIYPGNLKTSRKVYLGKPMVTSLSSVGLVPENTRVYIDAYPDFVREYGADPANINYRFTVDNQCITNMSVQNNRLYGNVVRNGTLYCSVYYNGIGGMPAKMSIAVSSGYYNVYNTPTSIVVEKRENNSDMTTFERKPPMKYELYNSQGLKISEGTVDAEGGVVDVFGLSRGFYIFKLTVSQKVVETTKLKF